MSYPSFTLTGGNVVKCCLDDGNRIINCLEEFVVSFEVIFHTAE